MAGAVRIGPKRFRRLYIAEHREAHTPKLSQAELGARLGKDGVSGMTVSRWERATDDNWPKNKKTTAEVTWPVMAAIAEALGLSDPTDLAKHPNDINIDAMLRDKPKAVKEIAHARVLDVIRRAG